jgi:hypothetical protein
MGRYEFGQTRSIMRLIPAPREFSLHHSSWLFENDEVVKSLFAVVGRVRELTAS